MKGFKLFKVVGVGVLVANLATLPSFPTSAQAGKVTDSSHARPGDTAIYETGKTAEGATSKLESRQNMLHSSLTL